MSIFDSPGVGPQSSDERGETKALWATPIWQSRMGSADSLNLELAAALVEYCEKTKVAHHGMNTVDLSRRVLTKKDSVSLIPKSLIEFFMTQSSMFLKSIQPNYQFKVERDDIYRLWVSVYKNGEFSAPHIYDPNNSILVGTYFVATPDMRDDLQGSFTLLRPSGQLGAPSWYQMFNSEAEVRLSPTPGMLAMFAPHVVNYIHPHQSSGRSISISFEISSNVLERAGF